MHDFYELFEEDKKALYMIYLPDRCAGDVFLIMGPNNNWSNGAFVRNIFYCNSYFESCLNVASHIY